MQTDGYMVMISEQKDIYIYIYICQSYKKKNIKENPVYYNMTPLIVFLSLRSCSCSWTALSFSLPGWLLHHSISFILHLPHA